MDVNGLILLGLILVVRRRRSRDKVKIAVVSIDEFEDSDIEILPQDPIVVSVPEVDDENEYQEAEIQVSVESNEDSQPDTIEVDTSSPRRERRLKRQQAKALSELGDMPLPPPPGSASLGDLPPPPGSPSLGDLPPPPGSASLGDLPPPPDPSRLGMMDREVSCPSCSAVFTLRDPSISVVECPVCDERFGV